MNVTDMDDMANEAVPTASDLVDPLDEPLEERFVLDDVYYEAARQYVTIDGMDYSFEKPRYMLYDDQAWAKRKLKEAYSQKESLFTYGFSGSGKTTMLEQFSDRYPNRLSQSQPSRNARLNGTVYRSSAQAALLRDIHAGRTSA